MTAMSGPTRARWFNPTAAAYTDAGGGLPSLGAMAFVPPGDNGTGFNDWVLLLEKQYRELSVLISRTFIQTLVARISRGETVARVKLPKLRTGIA